MRDQPRLPATYEPGDVIIREGEPGERFYMIAEGRARASENGKQLNEMNAPGSFGEIALLRRRPRVVTITATNRREARILAREEFLAAVTGNPESYRHAAFQHAWTFGAICLFAAGLGCLLVGHIDADEAPALGDAARVVLAESEPREAVHAPGPRPRRVIAPDIADPAAPRGESAADFLARTPLFSGIDPGFL